jgi:hypothetical protein
MKLFNMEYYLLREMINWEAGWWRWWKRIGSKMIKKVFQVLSNQKVRIWIEEKST